MLMLQINLSDIGEIYKVRLELSPMKQTHEPEWKIKTVILFSLSVDKNCSISYNIYRL